MTSKNDLVTFAGKGFNSGTYKSAGLRKKCAVDIKIKIFSLLKEFLGFWTLSIVRCLKEHDVSETGSVSVLR
jgi:hypothetical protein